jgi:hypothetical protein
MAQRNAYSSPALAVASSANAKIGMAAATYASQASCPKTCPFFKKGCYAEHGPVGITTLNLNRVEENNPTAIAQSEADAIDLLPGILPLRLHVVGDCATEESARIVSEAAERYSTRWRKRTADMPVWAYTHAHDVPRDAWGKVSILRSCESMSQVVQAHEDGYAAELTVGAFEQDSAYDLGDGFVGIPCPQQTGKVKTCIDCGLCMRDSKLHDSKRVILLKAHGSRKFKVAATVRETPVEDFEISEGILMDLALGRELANA